MGLHSGKSPGRPWRADSLFVWLCGISILWGLACHACRGEKATQPSNVEIYLVDDFGGEEPHGELVAKILQEASFGRIPIHRLRIGDDPLKQRKVLLQQLLLILEKAKENPGKRYVVNLSLGSDVPNPLEETAVRRLENEGVTLVASAGNDGTEEPKYPAAYDRVIAVAAVDNSGHRWKHSNYGRHIAIAALVGGETKMRYLGSEDHGNYVSDKYSISIKEGTSFAAPRVAGVMAHLLSTRPDLTPDKVLRILKAHAAPVEDLSCGALCPYRALLSEDPFFKDFFWKAMIGLGVFLIFFALAVRVTGEPVGPGIFFGAVAIIAWPVWYGFTSHYGMIQGTYDISIGLGVAGTALFFIFVRAEMGGHKRFAPDEAAASPEDEAGAGPE